MARPSLVSTESHVWSSLGGEDVWRPSGVETSESLANLQVLVADSMFRTRPLTRIEGTKF